MSEAAAKKSNRPSVGGMFNPINEICLDCKGSVRIDDRQEIAWDEDGRCRRRCLKCINRRKAEQEN
jgi:hypothetical protein